MAFTGKFEFCEDVAPYRSSFESKYRNGKFTDVTIKIGDQDHRAHRIVLSAVFPYFDILFERSTANDSEQEITLRNIDPKAAKCLLDFAYTGKIKIDSENVKELAVAANYLKHTKIRKACLEFLSGQFSPENVLDLRTLGNSMNCYEFVGRADSFICEKFEMLHKTPAFLNASFELVMEIVSRNDIELEETENVYKAITKWLKFDTERTNKFMELIISVQKQLPLPFKRCINETKNIYISPALLDTIHCDEDAFGIYTVSASGSYNRIVHNYNTNTSSWLRISQHNLPRSFTTVASACGLIFALTGDNLEVFDRYSWKPCGVLPWEVKIRSGNVVSLGKKIYWFPNIWEKDCSVWCFDVECKEWKEERPSVKLISPGIVSLGRYIYILGGFKLTGVTAAAMTYDPYHKDFKNISPMLRKRCNPGCAALNDKVYACGGYGGESSYLITAEIYNPPKDEWQFISPLRKKWTNFSLVPCDGKLILIGRQLDENNTVEVYDAEENVWKSGPEFPDRWRSLKAVVLSI